MRAVKFEEENDKYDCSSNEGKIDIEYPSLNKNTKLLVQNRYLSIVMQRMMGLPRLISQKIPPREEVQSQLQCITESR